MAIYESLILVCTLVGKLCIGKISGAKGSNLELLVDFRQKDEKSTRGQPRLWSIEESKAESRECGTREFRKIDREPKSQLWSTPRVKVKVRDKFNLVTHQEASTSLRIILGMVRSPLDYSFPLSLIGFYPIVLH